MGRLNLPVTMVLLLIGWATGTAFFPLGGTIHFLLIVVLIVFIIDRVGRLP